MQGVPQGEAAILEQRRVLSQEELHTLASKTRTALHADEGKATCHSDYTDDETAKTLQAVELVELETP